jgi:hypothetical protein
MGVKRFAFVRPGGLDLVVLSLSQLPRLGARLIYIYKEEMKTRFSGYRQDGVMLGPTRARCFLPAALETLQR